MHENAGANDGFDESKTFAAFSKFQKRVQALSVKGTSKALSKNFRKAEDGMKYEEGRRFRYVIVKETVWRFL